MAPPGDAMCFVSSFGLSSLWLVAPPGGAMCFVPSLDLSSLWLVAPPGDAMSFVPSCVSFMIFLTWFFSFFVGCKLPCVWVIWNCVRWRGIWRRRREEIAELTKIVDDLISKDSWNGRQKFWLVNLTCFDGSYSFFLSFFDRCGIVHRFCRCVLA